MKRSIWSAALSAALFPALFPALPLTAAEPEDFRYFEELVPPATISPERLNSVRLNADVLSAIASPDDLRLFSADGRELPFKREPVFTSRELFRSNPVRSRVESFDVESGRAVLVVEAGVPGENGAVLNHVAIRTGEQNFEKRVSISGLDDISWRPLADHLPFFDRNPRFAIGRKEFSIPEGRYRKLRIEIDNYGEDYVSPLRKLTAGDDPAVRREEREVLFRELKIDGVELSRSVFDRVSVSPVLARYTPEIRSVVVDRGKKTTVIEFDCGNLPLASLTLTTQSTNFSRKAVLTEEDENYTRPCQFEDVSLPGFRWSAMSVPLDGGRRLGICRLTIRDGDNAPLEQPALTAEYPVYRLMTWPKDIPARLCFGGDGVPPGEYDLPATLASIDSARLGFNEFRAGIRKTNPDCRVGGFPDRLDLRWIFFCVIGILVLTLVIFIVRNFSKIEGEGPDE